MPCRHQAWSSSSIAEPVSVRVGNAVTRVGFTSKRVLATLCDNAGAANPGSAPFITSVDGVVAFAPCNDAPIQPIARRPVNPDSAWELSCSGLFCAPLEGAVACERVQFLSTARESERGGH